MNIRLLFEYDAWATAKLLESVGSLSPEQFIEEGAGSLSSVRQQFVHLLSVSDRYRARLAQDEVPDVSAESFATPQELIAYAAQVRHRLNSFLASLDEDEDGNCLHHVVEHMTRKGSFTASVEETLFHMANHATYHRGQIACLLKLHGVEFADTDFIIWVRRTPE